MVIIEHKLKKSQIEAIADQLYDLSPIMPAYYDLLKPIKRLVSSKEMYLVKTATNGKIGESILYDAAAEHGIDLHKLKIVGDDIFSLKSGESNKFIEKLKAVVPFNQLLFSVLTRASFGSSADFVPEVNYILSGVDVSNKQNLELIASRCLNQKCVIISEDEVTDLPAGISYEKYENPEKLIRKLLSMPKEQVKDSKEIIIRAAKANADMRYSTPDEIGSFLDENVLEELISFANQATVRGTGGVSEILSGGVVLDAA